MNNANSKLMIPDNLVRSYLSKCQISYVMNSLMIIKNINLYIASLNRITPLKLSYLLCSHSKETRKRKIRELYKSFV